MKRIALAASAAILSLVILAVSAPAGEVTEPQFLKFVTGSIGGNWYVQAGTLAETIKSGLPDGSDVTVVPGSGVSNIATISLGNVDLGHAHSIYASWAATGTGPFPEKFPNVRGVCTLEDQYLMIIATKNSGVVSLKDAAAQKKPVRVVSQRPASDGGGLLGAYVGEEVGWGKAVLTDAYKDLRNLGGRFLIANSHSESVANLIDGKADVWFSVAANGMAQIVELQSSRDIVFVQLDDDILQAMHEKYNLPFHTVPAGTFAGQDKDYKTLGVQSTMAANVNTPNEIVYAALKALADNRDSLVEAFPKLSEFKPETSWERVGFELHPGAAQYYRDMGYMK